MSGRLGMKLLLCRASRQRLAIPRSTQLTRGVRRWSSAKSGEGGGGNAHKAEPAASSNTVSSVRTATPGTVRIRRGTDPRAQEVEMDTTIARIMGSDWGDRSKQPVSFAMKLYWGIFALVLVNGAFTYLVGKDEKYLVDKVQKKVDQKLGRIETNEFVVMADQQNKPRTTETVGVDEPSAKAVVTEAMNVSLEAQQRKQTQVPFDPTTNIQAKGVLSSKTAPTPMPFFGSPLAQRQLSRVDCERQLHKLRQRQALVREERNDGTTLRSVEEMNMEIKRIDQQKAQIKQIMESL